MDDNIQTLIPGLDMENTNQEKVQNAPVECLGRTFANDQERRDYYLAILAEKLKDPEFRKIEGFPIGEDDDILNLSDPPYYTACPNPWIADFITEWEANKPEQLADYHYHREPFAADVSEGKNDPIYNVHSYHTKVPHKAIMRYILHYTNPGDIVFDGFCGTGMTGIAGALCAELGSNRTPQVIDGKIGDRKVVISDLSPIASFISGGLLRPTPTHSVTAAANRIYQEINKDFGYLYSTKHNGWKVRDRKICEHKLYSYGDDIKGKVEFTVYSDSIGCPECDYESTFYEIAVDEFNDKLRTELKCPSCNSIIPENKWERIYTTNYDQVLKKAIKTAKIVPILINYTIGKTRYEKLVDSDDLKLLKEAEAALEKISLPSIKLISGKETQRNTGIGITHIHQFFTNREHLYIALLLKKIISVKDINVKSALLLSLTSSLPYASRMRRFRADRKGGGPLSGTLYVGSLITPPNVLETFKRNLATIIVSLFKPISPLRGQVVSTQSANCLPNIHDNSIDYIFTDPPFGHNFDYSELNFLWEAILNIYTNQFPEAIISSSQGKGVDEYRELMEASFKEYYRVLKPGHWVTVEFSNSKASVWNAIQSALVRSGFVVANVTGLDKKQLSFKAVMTPTAVKQDLVISAYKPDVDFEDRFVIECDEEGVWDFIRTHLGYLPIVKKDAGELIKVPERDPRILFDQVVSYFVRNFRDVPLSSREFQEGLLERFAERDGMIFLPEQVSQYDKARMTSTQLRQMTIFVDDEASAIEWLRQLLNDKPQTYQDMHPKFIHELSGWKNAELQLELSTLLEQNFLKFDGQGQIPSQIHSYLSTYYKEMRNLAKDDSALLHKAKDRWYVPNPEREEDLQKLRERSLLKLFEEYKTHTGKKIKVVRMEAVRAGFKRAWQDRDYPTIIQVAEKIPENLLQEDQKLLMWYDQAQTRHSDSGLL